MLHATVPRATQVVPGVGVNIVLKADQRTGRQVSGTVRDVLTRGDHHRGIKVRLADGRIGRVQSLASSPPFTSSASTESASGVDGLAPGQPSFPAPDHQGQSHGRRRGRYRDIREDEALGAPAEQTDLSAYIVPARPRGKAKKASATLATDSPELDTASQPSRDVVSANVTCPVCNAFEGDEAAVAHHVAQHFE